MSKIYPFFLFLRSLRWNLDEAILELEDSLS